MKIRQAVLGDVPRLKELHAMQDFDYELPSLDKLLTTFVLEDSQGIVQQAVAARVTTEIYFLCNSDWDTPGTRFMGLGKLHKAMERELKAKGVQDVHAWLPPRIARYFGRRLQVSFGWIKSEWPSFSRMV